MLSFSRCRAPLSTGSVLVERGALQVEGPPGECRAVGTLPLAGKVERPQIARQLRKRCVVRPGCQLLRLVAAQCDVLQSRKGSSGDV